MDIKQAVKNLNKVCDILYEMEKPKHEELANTVSRMEGVLEHYDQLRKTETTENRESKES